MLKLAFEYLTDSYPLLENPLHNYIIMAVVGFIAYKIAYKIVGRLYDSDLIDGRGAGHVLHWIFRFIIFLLIYYAVATAIRIYYWIIEVPMLVWEIAILVMVLAMVLIVFMKSRGKKALK